MRKIMIALVVFLLAIAVGFLTYWSYHVLDTDLYKARIKHLVKHYTGRELGIQGNFGVRLGWYPKVTLGDVTLTNTPGATPPYMLQAKQISFQMVLHDLMRRHFVTKNITIEGAYFILQKNAKGQWNWSLLQQTTVTDPKLLKTYPRMNIENSTVSYQPSQRAIPIEVSLKTSSMDFSRGKGLVSLAVNGRYEALALPFDVAMTLDLNPKHGYPIHGQITLDGNPLQIDGTLAPAALTLHLRGLNTAALSKWIGIPLSAKTPFDFSTQLTQINSGYQLSNLRLTLGQSDITGNLTMSQSQHYAADLLLTSKDTGQLLNLLQINHSLKGGSLEVRAKVQAEGQGASELLKTLQGHVSVALRDTIYSGKATSNLAKLLGKGSIPSQLPINCFISRFNISHGLASTPVFVFDGPGATVYGHGAVDLGAKRLNVQLQPKSKSVQLLSLEVPVEISGSLDNPSVTAQLPKTKLMVAALSMASGVGMVTALGAEVALNTLNHSDGNPCLQALSSAPKSGAK